MGMITKYGVEIFFRTKTIDNNTLDMIPDLDNYLVKTRMESFSTWDDVENEVLRRFPHAAYYLVHSKEVDLLSEQKTILRRATETLGVNISRIHGRGLFALAPIEKEDVLFNLGGELVSLDELAPRHYPSGEWNAISSTHFLVRKERTLYGFINHSRNPNAAIDFSSLYIYALTEIPKGTEITIDYRNEALPVDYLNGYGKEYL
jgi:hypothetical protein